MSTRTYRFWVDDDFIDKYAAHLSPAAFRVYIAYCRHQNAEGIADISVKGLCAELRIGHDQVVDARQELVAIGLLAPVPPTDRRKHPFQIVSLAPVRNDPTAGPILPQERSQGRNDSVKQEKQRKRLESLRKRERKKKTVPRAGTFLPQERNEQTVPTSGTEIVPTVRDKGSYRGLEEEEGKKNPPSFPPYDNASGTGEGRPRKGISGTDLSPALVPACADPNSPIPCAHMTAALDLIETKLTWRPHATNHQLHTWVHMTGHTVEDLGLLYDYALSQHPDKHCWQNKPNNVCSPKNADDLILARQWAANGQASRALEAPCTHPDTALRQHETLGYWHCTIPRCGTRLPTEDALARGLDVPDYLRHAVQDVEERG